MAAASRHPNNLGPQGEHGVGVEGMMDNVPGVASVELEMTTQPWQDMEKEGVDVTAEMVALASSRDSSTGPLQPQPHLQPQSEIQKKVEVLRETGNFDGWIALIAEVDETAADMEAISVVYDSFLSEYPLCHHYWIKYAAHKARLCSLKAVEEMYNDALERAPYLVPLWVGYCKYAETAYAFPDHVRSLYVDALKAVGKSYLSYLLWDNYIEFENSQKGSDRLAKIYVGTLEFPTKKLNSYFKCFKELGAKLKEQVDQNMVPSDRESENQNVSSDTQDSFQQQEMQKISDALRTYLQMGEEAYSKSSDLDKKISTFESCIKRSYFHVDPLDNEELQNWHNYLDFAETQTDFEWAVNLYERCLIPCALYSEFWIRYVEYTESKLGREVAILAMHRALNFLKRDPSPNFKFYCATYKEDVGDFRGSRSVLFSEGRPSYDSFENVTRTANMEKRMKNYEAACSIYENAIDEAKTKQNFDVLPKLYINYAKFTYSATHSVDAAKKIFRKGIQHAPSKSMIQGFIQFADILGGLGLVQELDCLIEDFTVPGSAISGTLSYGDCEDISLLYLEFVDLHGSVQQIKKALARHSRSFSRKTKDLLNATSIGQNKCNNTNGHTITSGASGDLIQMEEVAGPDLIQKEDTAIDGMINADDMAADDHGKSEQTVGGFENEALDTKELVNLGVTEVTRKVCGAEGGGAHSPKDKQASGCFNGDMQMALPVQLQSTMLTEEQLQIQPQPSDKLAEAPQLGPSSSPSNAKTQEEHQKQTHDPSASIAWSMPTNYQGYTQSVQSSEQYNHWLYYQQQLYLQSMHQNQLMNQKQPDGESQQMVQMQSQMTHQQFVWQQYLQSAPYMQQQQHTGQDSVSSVGQDQQHQHHQYVQEQKRQFLYYQQQQQLYQMQQQQQQLYLQQQLLQQQMLQQNQPQHQQDMVQNQQMQIYQQQLQLYHHQQMQHLQMMQQANSQGLQPQTHNPGSQPVRTSEPQNIERSGASCPSTPQSQRSNQ